MLNINEKKLEAFQRSIEKQAQAKIHGMEEEIEAYRKEQMNIAEDEVLNDAYKIIQKEVSKSAMVASLESAKKTAEYRKELLQKRNEYTDNFFAEAQKRILDFCTSADYEKFLLKNAEKLAVLAPYDDSEIQVRSADMKFSEQITKAFGRQCTITENVSLTLGGLKLVNKSRGIIVDESLDCALNEQKEWFRNNSGFLVAPL